MPDDRSHHTVFYGLDPSRPVAFTLPPVEATPDQPSPDAGSFPRVCAGVEEPGKVIQRVAELVGLWRHTHEQRPSEPRELEQLNLTIWLIDREAGGHTKQVAYQADAPLTPSTYGRSTSWWWRYPGDSCACRRNRDRRGTEPNFHRSGCGPRLKGRRDGL